ncbi:hypothetical protein DID78_07150 [Candidatus Marinamargulisbacteria bacterium SCGC AG-343-D04]|nr:hypothetical protein DID78_07150 [Candidatus Marinamargulisbacteria bacterium SCGC AG-343-D04]
MAKKTLITGCSGTIGTQLCNIFRQQNIPIDVPIDIKDSRIGEIDHYIGDISKAKKLLNYSPQFSIEKGIDLSIQWYKNYFSNGISY